MQVGDLVKHTGADGWHNWCDADTPRYYRELSYYPEHLEALNENR
jgi:hypothetical protein